MSFDKACGLDPHGALHPTESDLELHKLVQSMRETKNDFLNNKANKFRGEEGFGALMDALKERSEIFKNRKGLVVYKCSSWCKFPLYETDFRWGKPVWNTSINKLVSNTISLQDTTADAIEVLITLDGEEMSIFEQHEELLEFASVNPGPTLMFDFANNYLNLGQNAKSAF